MDEIMINRLMCAAAKDILNTRYGVATLPKNNAENPIEKVIFNPPATIVFWKSGEKTVVKTRGDDLFTPERGLAMAICKHYLCDICGLKRYDGIFNKYVPEEEGKPNASQAVASNSVQYDGLSRALGAAFMSGVFDALSKRENYEDAD